MENVFVSFDNKNIQHQQSFVDVDRMAGVATKSVNKSFDNVLSSYQIQPEAIEIELVGNKEKNFGFLDIVDMVNPLQHIPVVNYIYRAITGDEIKPVSKIVGGGIFGGAAGAASSVVTAIIEEETGKDVVENAMSFVGSDKNKSYNVEKERYAYKDLPASLLEFAETPLHSRNVAENSNKYAMVAQGRSAGNISVYS